jgi:hypothetical protein
MLSRSSKDLELSSNTTNWVFALNVHCDPFDRNRNQKQNRVANLVEPCRRYKYISDIARRFYPGKLFEFRAWLSWPALVGTECG